MNAAAPCKTFADHVEAYLAHWRALGRRYRQEEWLLRTLLRELPDLGQDDLNAQAFARWFENRKDRHPNTRRKWAQLLHHFCVFRQRSEQGCFVPGPELVCRRQPYVMPVIISPAQIARMIEIAGRLEPSPNSPLRAAVMRLAVVLLYTTGMRLGELRRLALQDVEDGGAVLRIRESKFHKTRLLPLSASAQLEVRQFMQRRAEAGFDLRPAAALLSRHTRRGSIGYSIPGLQGGINALFAAAEVTDATGRRPRVHDMRHSFALQVLARWYRQDADVQVQLPKLAMYMGHVSIESTAHYLRWSPEVAALASDRFGRHFAAVIGAQS
jgi:integrase